MSLAKEINKRLDQILDMKAELIKLKKELNKGGKLKTLDGRPATKQEALKVVDGMMQDIYKEINSLTNNGLNVKDIFTNKYYINDVMQDRELVKQENSKERNKPTDPNAEFISWDENA
jgi:hypothetical protein